MKNIILLFFCLVILSCSKKEENPTISEAWLSSMKIDGTLEPHTFLSFDRETGVIGGVDYSKHKFDYKINKDRYTLNILNEGKVLFDRISMEENRLVMLNSNADTLVFKKIKSLGLTKNTIKNRLNGNSFLLKSNSFTDERIIHFNNNYAIIIPIEFSTLPGYLSSMEIISFDKEKFKIVEFEGFFFLMLDKYKDSRMLDIVGVIQESKEDSFEIMNYINRLENEVYFSKIENDNNAIKKSIIGQWGKNPSGMNLSINANGSFNYNNKNGTVEGDWSLDASGKILILSNNNNFFKIAAIGNNQIGIEDEVMGSITSLLRN